MLILTVRKLYELKIRILYSQCNLKRSLYNIHARMLKIDRLDQNIVFPMYITTHKTYIS